MIFRDSAMLLKYTNNSSSTYNGKGKAAKVTSRIHRKTLKIASKPGKKAPGKKISFGKNQKNFQASKNFPPTTTSLCDNSNDSGLGFDESHHHHHPTLALTTSNLSSSNISYHRSLNNLRYSDVIQTPACTITQTTQEAKKAVPIATGKKVKNVAKPSTSKINKNLTLRTENEDTCNSDDFSSYYQTNTGNADCKSNSASVSPTTENFYQSSPEKRLSSSGSEGSSPTTSSGESPSPTLVSVSENLEDLPATSLHKQFNHVSRNGTAQLQIITQPEQQHRARYQTEGSRGAVKDRSGNGFPVVKLNGYNKPTTLQVFIGNDVGRVSPHIFYQACKVSGKNSTPCYETKTEGTMVIEIELKPENDMTVICDCVGILKERNVDVEHRLGGRNHTLAASVTRNKKKSTKCRMIFRAKLNEDSDFPEIVQICSNTITCTQPPGVPEICKKSLDACTVIGGKELFIIGKNFLKDTKVTFVHFDDSRQPKKLWEESVQPDKEYLQQTHLICVVPPYPNGDSIFDPVHIQIYVTSSNKKSEPHNFMYLPLKKSRSLPHSPITTDPGNLLFKSPQDKNSPAQQQQQHMVQNVLSIGWNESAAENMMPPPLIMPRKPSFSKNLPETSPTEASITLKTEFIDQTQHSVINGGDVSQQDITTSSTAGLQPPVPVTMFGDSAMIDVTRMQNPYAAQDAQALMASSGYSQEFDGFKLQSNEPTIDLRRIKSEQSPEQVSSPTGMLPPPPPAQELNSVQQQQVVENFLNMIVQSSVMNEPNHHLTQDMMLNAPAANATQSNVPIQSEQMVNSAPSMNILSSAITPSVTMMCEPNMILVPNELNLEVPNANALVSNAVSDAAAETQAVVKQMIAQAAAEILSETGPQETQSSISNFISNILPPPEQQQIPSTQQLQEMLAQELNAATSSLMQDVVKKEENNDQQVQTIVQENLIDAAPAATAPTTSITQPFSPTTQDLTAMSESDLISFINPSVFM